jgi:hypothetical protein
MHPADGGVHPAEPHAVERRYRGVTERPLCPQMPEIL